MSKSHGRFVWYELMTSDTEGAKAFYGQAVGWGTKPAPVPGMPYTLFTAADTPVSGLMEQPEEIRKTGAPPAWLGYVAADDVDAIAEQVKRRGGSVHVPPTDIPSIGRFAIALDPQGAAFGLFKPLNAGDEPPPPAPGTPGRVGWHELRAAEWEKAFAFYSDLFGWQKAEAFDMGAMGTYQLFAAGGQTIGGMFNKPPAMPAPHWLYYFNVDNIDAAVERVKAGGGQILHGPAEVPGGSWIIQGKDPQGAMFALVGRKA